MDDLQIEELQEASVKHRMDDDDDGELTTVYCSFCMEALRRRAVSIDHILPVLYPDESFCSFGCARKFYLEGVPPSRPDLQAQIEQAFAAVIDCDCDDQSGDEMKS